MESAKLHNRELSPVNRLPNELLTWIFELCINATAIASPSCDVHRHCKRQLASVSRHWRSAILHSPSFWATIKLAPTWSHSLVKAHVARSSSSFLAIEMCPWPPERWVTATFRAMLDLLVGCAHRWRSLVIQGDVNGFQLEELFDRMEHKSFPSLTHFSVELVPRWLLDTSVSQFFTQRFPRLDHLGLGGVSITSRCVQIPPNLTSLALAVGCCGSSSVLQQLSFRNLTTLTLSGCAGEIKLDPDSISLPLLEKLVCNASQGNVLLQAIVAPNLIHLEYRHREFAGLALAGNLFNLHTPRYPNVTHLSVKRIECCNEVASFQFPAVRHIALDNYGLGSLFDSTKGPTTPYWLELESVTVEDLNVDMHDELASWLEKRPQMGLPKLLVNLTASDDWYDFKRISKMCVVLHPHCTLEVGGVRFDSTVDIILGDRPTVSA